MNKETLPKRLLIGTLSGVFLEYFDYIERCFLLGYCYLSPVVISPETISQNPTS